MEGCGEHSQPILIIQAVRNEIQLLLQEAHHGRNHATLGDAFRGSTKELILTASVWGLLRISVLSLLIERTNALGRVGWNRWYYQNWRLSLASPSLLWQPWWLGLFSPRGKKKTILFLRTVKKRKRRSNIDLPDTMFHIRQISIK